MPYRFKRDETVPDAVRRVAGEEFDSLLSELSHADGAKRDEAIHEARKSVKKVRALLRLVQPEIGEAYRTESRVLRDAGRQLSELRDAKSVMESLEKLQEKYPDKLRRPVVDPIRRALAAKKKQGESHANVPAVLRKIETTLKAARKRVHKWPISTSGFAAVEPGLAAALRKGRVAFQQAKKTGRPEDYHEWRKRLKDHWYHVRLLEDVWTEWMQGYEASLQNVETWLGDDHNLELLRSLLTNSEWQPTTKSLNPILDLIGEYQKELRKNAESVGERIYGEKPKQFARRMRQLWDEWRTEPKSLEKFEKAVRKKTRTTQ